MIISQNGNILSTDKYSIDLANKIFDTEERELVLDFRGLYGWTFYTGFECTFKTGPKCTFTTGNYCTFKTGSECTFTTGHECTFKTGWNCTFKTGDNCTFSTGSGCTFTTGDTCIFLLWDINTCKFKFYDCYSIILDREDNKHYLLTKELIDMLKVKNG